MSEEQAQDIFNHDKFDEATKIKYLNEKGIQVFARDPMCSNEEIIAFGAQPKQDFKEIDAIIVAASHKEFKDIDWNSALKEMDDKTVFDGVGMLDREIIEKAGGNYLAWGASKE